VTAAGPADALVVVIGAALVDVRATAGRAGRRGESVPGTARLSAGGAARNVAVDLARFGRRVVLLTAVGDDHLGRWLLSETSTQGVNVSHTVTVGRRTGLFVSVSPDGGEPWCVSDASGVDALTPQHVAGWAPIIAQAAVVVTDANVGERVLRAVGEAAGPIPRVLLATSPEKSHRLRHVIDGAEAIVGNLDEGRAFVGEMDSAADWRRVGAALVRAGARRAVVTLGPLGIGLATRDVQIDIEPPATPIVDTLGAGDAVAAAVIHGLIAGMGPREMLALAARAAALVAQSTDATPLSLREVALA
jgi:pseudouridine kinase